MRYYVLFITIFYLKLGWGQELIDSAVSLNQGVSSLASLELRIQTLESSLIKPSPSMDKIQVGFSFGFNGFFNGPQSYYIQSDSTLGSYGNTRGVTGMIIALLGYNFKNNHTLYLNIPLSDLSPSEGATLGIFNRQIAGGLGYGFTIGSIALISVINIYPYEEPALDLLENKKYEQEPFTQADLEDVPMIGTISPSLTIGVCYHLINGNNVPSLLK